MVKTQLTVRQARELLDLYADEADRRGVPELGDRIRMVARGLERPKMLGQPASGRKRGRPPKSVRLGKWERPETHAFPSLDAPPSKDAVA